MTHTQVIISIILGSGILGGLTNFIVSYQLEYTSKECWINFCKSILLGLCASLAVPLFLQILSNNLLDLPGTDAFPHKNYFILTGFCIIAAVFSKRFLEDLYSKVKNLEKENAKAKKEIQDNTKRTMEVDKKIGNLEENLEEGTESTIPSDIKQTLSTNQNFGLSEDESKNILAALFSAKYSFRTIPGISEETSISESRLEKIFEHLLEMGFAEKRVNYKGVDLWRLLKYPIRIYSASYGIPGSSTDVTFQIQELLAKQVYQGIVLPSTFSVPDPAPGLAKTLKIHCRIRGKETELSFIDGQTFQIM